MPPESIMDRQKARRSAVALCRIRERHGAGPLAAERLNESRCLAVGFGRIGPGADGTQPQRAECIGKRLGDIGQAAVAHQPLAHDALAAEPGDRTAEKADHH